MVSPKYHCQIVRTLYLFLNMLQFNDIYLLVVPIPKTRKCEDDIMAVSYKKLWKLLIDKDVKSPLPTEIVRPVPLMNAAAKTILNALYLPVSGRC